MEGERREGKEHRDSRVELRDRYVESHYAHFAGLVVVFLCGYHQAVCFRCAGTPGI